MSIRRTLRKWLLGPTYSSPVDLADSTQQINLEATEESAEFRFSVSKAINGKVITVSRFKRNPHGPDWSHQLYIVPEGEDLMDAVKTCMAITALSK